MDVKAKKQDINLTFNRVAKSYDFLNRVLSFWIDVYWRKHLIKNIIKSQTDHLLDIATGTCDVVLTLLRSKNPPAKITAFDPAENMIEIGKVKVKKHKLGQRVDYKIGRAEQLPYGDDSFDALTISFGLRNISHRKQGLSEMSRVLKSQGKLHILEFSMPSSFLIRWPYLFYFRHVLPTLGGLISGDREAYEYLNQSVEGFPPPSDIADELKEVGFKVRYRPMTFGIVTLYEAEKI